MLSHWPSRGIPKTLWFGDLVFIKRTYDDFETAFKEVMNSVDLSSASWNQGAAPLFDLRLKTLRFRLKGVSR